MTTKEITKEPVKNESKKGTTLGDLFPKEFDTLRETLKG